MIKFAESPHFYTHEGEARYDADLKVARKEKLYVSPTTIDKDVFVNHFLTKWSKNQLAKAAGENPRMMEESLEDYANRIYEISMKKATDAAAFGKKVHDALEHYPDYPTDPEVIPHYEAFVPWFQANVQQLIHREHIVVDHDLGVAGMMDLKAIYKNSIAILDYKTQDVKKDDKGRKKPAYYDSWVRQLAFYAVADAKMSGTFPDIPPCVSVVIDSNEPCDPFVKEWDPEIIRKAYRQFVVGVWQYCSGKGHGGYWPGRFGEWHPMLDPIPMI